jgi:hypothetical protein
VGLPPPQGPLEPEMALTRSDVSMRRPRAPRGDFFSTPWNVAGGWRSDIPRPAVSSSIALWCSTPPRRSPGARPGSGRR